MAATADKSKPYIPLAGDSNEGAYSNKDEATATCFCGAVQLAFSLTEPGLVKGGNHVCNCTDCRKITASMFASNFTVNDTHLKHLRGQDLLSTYCTSKTTTTGNSMTNYFCKVCGTLMYRKGGRFQGQTFMRIGTVDDFNLHETVLKPEVEQFTKDRVSWLSGPVKDAKQCEVFFYQ